MATVEEDCWHGKVSSREAERRLVAVNKTNAYLFRESDIKRNKFILSYISDKTRGLFKHLIVPAPSVAAITSQLWIVVVALVKEIVPVAFGLRVHCREYRNLVVVFRCQVDTLVEAIVAAVEPDDWTTICSRRNQQRLTIAVHLPDRALLG